MRIFTPTRPPRAHQREAQTKARGRRAFFYQMDMGTGKSKTVWDETLELYLLGEIDQVLVLAGKGSYGDWIEKHLPENTPDDVQVRAHLWRGDSAREQRRLRTLVSPDLPPALRCLIVNYEAFSREQSVAATVARNFLRLGRTMMICDESTKIRHADSTRTQVVCELARLSHYRRAMTGLASPRNILDLWSQFVFLGLEQHLASNYHSFRARYCTMVKMKVPRMEGGKRVMRWINGQQQPAFRNVSKITGVRDIDELRECINPHRFRVLKEECLDLPPKIYHRVVVELTREQERAYRDMSRMAVTELEDGSIASATHAMTRVMRMHQIVSGHIVDEQRIVHLLDTNRLQVMTEQIEEMTGKVAIWCAYRTDIVRVQQHLSKEYPDDQIVTYYGSTSDADREKAKRAFQDGSARFWISSYQTGSLGLTLTACSNVINYSHTYDLEHRLQAEDRFHRDGQTRAVNYIDLVTPGTVDERIFKALREKKNIADQLAGGGLRAWLDYQPARTSD